MCISRYHSLFDILIESIFDVLVINIYKCHHPVPIRILKIVEHVLI